jgi:hypothetical protein
MKDLCMMLRCRFLMPQFAGKDPFTEKTYNGLNIDLVEEILGAAQSRLCLYYMCEKTG